MPLFTIRINTILIGRYWVLRAKITTLSAIPDPLVQVLDAEGNAEDGDGGDDVVAPTRGAVDAGPPGYAEPAGRLLLAAAAGRHAVVRVDAVLSARAARRRPRAGRAQRPLFCHGKFCAADGLRGENEKM